MPLWIAFTLLAAFMQSVRTAGQKSLNRSVSTMTTTLVRYLYGIPFALIYLGFLLQTLPELATPALLAEISHSPRFLSYAVVASVAQILATFALVKVLAQRNFAAGTTFAKTEAIQVAVLGWLLFSETLSWLGWLAVMAGVTGTLVLSGLPAKRRELTWATVAWGVTSGLLFAITSLFLRQASLSLSTPPLMSAAATLAFMVCLQSLICLGYLAIREREQFGLLAQHQKPAWFVGATSAIGSIGWFTAMSLQNAALVKTLGQIEFLVTLLITHFYFREKIVGKEWLGMGLVMAGILLILIKQ